MPNAGDKIELSIAQNASNFANYIGTFAGYDTVTECYIIEDCYENSSYRNQAGSYKTKKFFNRKYVVLIEVI